MEPNQAPTQSPVETFDSQPKSHWLIVAFSVVGISLLAATVFLYLQNQKLQKKVMDQEVTSAIQTPSSIPNTESTTMVPTDETEGWKTYKDLKNGFSFKYPGEFVLRELSNRGQLLNEYILIITNNISYKDCRGGCPVNELVETILLPNNIQATKIKGYQGAVGGNIPQSFVSYEIVDEKADVSNRYVSITLWELPQNIPYQEMIKQYPADRIPQAIAEDKVQEFDQILSTFKFL